MLRHLDRADRTYFGSVFGRVKLRKDQDRRDRSSIGCNRLHHLFDLKNDGAVVELFAVGVAQGLKEFTYARS